MTGMVCDSWEFSNFSPMGAIPTAVSLTTYVGGPQEFMNTPLQKIVSLVEDGGFAPPIGRVFKIGDIVDAHRVMEEKIQREGKL